MFYIEYVAVLDILQAIIAMGTLFRNIFCISRPFNNFVKRHRYETISYVFYTCSRVLESLFTAFGFVFLVKHVMNTVSVYIDTKTAQ